MSLARYPEAPSYLYVQGRGYVGVEGWSGVLTINPTYQSVIFSREVLDASRRDDFHISILRNYRKQGSKDLKWVPVNKSQ